jgi:hypothetical protein
MCKLKPWGDTMNDRLNRDIEELPKEDVKNRSTGMPFEGDETRSGDGNSVADEEPGPYDDDGLPENAKRRVPS